VAAVLAAGMGTRVGADGNKAYLRVGGRSMVTWSLDTLSRVPGVTRVVLVFRRGERELAERTVSAELPSISIEFVEGGNSRHGSETNLLNYLAADIESGSVDVVLIHDAARPVAGPRLFGTALSVAREHGGAVPALPLDDVVALEADRVGVPDLPAGAALVGVQTPQAFRAPELLAAYRAAARDGFDGTDTSACVAAYTDVRVRTFPGDRRNIKVTYAPDVAVAERLLSSPGDPR
jgi:2-C-methyl-D-erythritol 4-phosphate cytidylyltransferase